jgi:hypothetical protein
MKFGAPTLVAVAAVAAVLGAGASTLALRAAQPAPAASLHEVVHENIDLTRDEHDRLAPLESSFHETRKRLEARVEEANRTLAAAMSTGEAAKVSAASIETKAALADLQDLTISHILAMREALDASHHAAFDAAVANSLGNGGS